MGDNVQPVGHATDRQILTRRPVWVGRTYLLTQPLIDRLDAVALAHSVGISDLVRFLLGAALDEVEAGEIMITTRPARLLEIDCG